ncbi:GldM family protein [Flavobacterium sp.]|uniref:GldM family protein n=1 Tax=Flavobacterium sp. TaxID=239 RepID=UPI000EF0A707|nr:GldM family protein [Flavobacterium sp.]HCQ14413.1 hypothetical protein [Flavobacterium sp.]
MKKVISVFFLFISMSFYGQNDTISVVYHTDNDFVIPKTTKIVYRGFLNEVFIDVPNSKSFEVEGIGVSQKEKNIYSINPSSGKELIIYIKGILMNGKKFSEKHIFEIRNVTSLEAKINNLDGFKVRMQKKNLLNAIIKCGFPDKNIGLKCAIKNFELRIPGYSSIHIDGNKIKEEYYKKIVSKIKIGDEIVLCDINFSVNVNANVCKINNIIIEIY